jgi:hypothetical protein
MRGRWPTRTTRENCHSRERCCTAGGCARPIFLLALLLSHAALMGVHSECDRGELLYSRPKSCRLFVMVSAPHYIFTIEKHLQTRACRHAHSPAPSSPNPCYRRPPWSLLRHLLFRIPAPGPWYHPLGRPLAPSELYSLHELYIQATTRAM